MLENRPLKCFVSYDSASAPSVGELKTTLRNLGVDCFDAKDVEPGKNIGGAIMASLNAADFVAVVIEGPSVSNFANFEAGVAVGLGKPLLLVTPREAFWPDLGSNVRYLWIKTEQLQTSKRELARFLRHVRQQPTQPSPPPHQTVDVTSAAESLDVIRSRAAPGRERSLEAIVADLFKQLHGDVSIEDETLVGNGQNYHRDMIVWSDPLVAQFGGPMVIECKYYGGGSGSVIVNARNTLAQLSKYVENSSAALGVLVYDHDRARQISIGPGESAKAVAISIDDLIDAFATGAVGDELWRRRARAASNRGFHGDAS